MATSSLDRLGFNSIDFEDWLDGSVILSAMVLIGIADGISLVLALPFADSASTFIAFSSIVLIWGVPILVLIEAVVGLVCIESALSKLLSIPIAVLLNGTMGFIGWVVLILLESVLGL